MRAYRASRPLAAFAMALLWWVGPVRADMVDLMGTGWQASWDASLDGLVDINPFSVSADGTTLFIQKSAEFTQPPVGGNFQSIEILFEQISPSSITHIVIDDEIITNSSGADWTDFHFDVEGVNAVFDPVATAASGGTGPVGFSIAPFTMASFANGNTRLDISGGVVPNGDFWFPGSGANDGQLWIDLDPLGPGQLNSFLLFETPTPEPGTLLLLLAGGVAVVRRRRI